MTWMPDRRAVLGGLGLSGLGLGALATYAPTASARTSAKVVIIGGGFGGATAARTLKATAPNVDVTLIETNRTYHSCPMSNLVIAGLKDASGQTFRYDALERLGINIVNGWATKVDAAARTVTVGENQTLSYDRLILSPGIAMRWGAISGYETGDAMRFPHAWKGRMQRRLLETQLKALEDGQNVLISVPRVPYRCPPGPYERASLIAHVLKTQKPRSKVIILDANTKELLGSWGPRPAPAQQLVIDYKNTPEPKPEYAEFQKQLHTWYARDKTVTTQAELVALLSQIV